MAHITNISAFVENGDLKAALAYKNKYKDEISLADSFKVDQRIHQKLEDQQVESLVNMATTGTQEGSNPALNVPRKHQQKLLRSLKVLHLIR